ncbi:hypothetical protein [Chitinasiproducens palmae]|uniref:Uncharacterized protein n=1 Tax=Chitinasiproducens palmae TaxID=1770053 RepID=A0A1H2PT78_9BURK|nr:hypothetical protein [Chitinasiproducens palmae]SDV50279.1 hypothetical protein SAMN05216551_11154 [Chitinasiproducens palmae]
MGNTKIDPHPDRAKQDEEGKIDENVELTFPASDPTPAGSNVTKIGDNGEEVGPGESTG